MGLRGADADLTSLLSRGCRRSSTSSAQLDGANKLQQIWHITLPAISPVIFFNGVMAIIASFQVFTNAFVITQGGPNYATWFMVYMIYQNAFTYISNMGYADALSLRALRDHARLHLPGVHLPGVPPVPERRPLRDDGHLS